MSSGKPQSPSPLSRLSLSSAPPLKTLPPNPNISQLENFAMSAMAPSMAVVFTLPFDTIKVRMQLQGEVRFIKDSTGKTIRIVAEKFRLFKKNLQIRRFTRSRKRTCSLHIKREFQECFSLGKITSKGLYDPILAVIHPTDDYTSSSSAPAWKRMFAGGLCGALGAVSANPFELVKTRLQSSAAHAIAVGNQYGYTSVTSALRRIMFEEGGIKGLYRGSMISVGRGILGSAANLSSYTMLKDYAKREGYSDGIPLDMACSLMSAFVSVIVMNPMDVVRTRLYNTSSISPRQSLLSTTKTIVKNEGWTALYRGFWTHFMRIGPHFCLTFVFLEQLKRGVKQFRLEEYQRQLQNYHQATTDLKV
ncbi:4521_t:CDS:2 [Cetraspora pellucida]|uniref:4521_t:CDS:1 n=1 Tax=Cetraspora pellucida TaxID=1433469 RepID=A0A9N9IDC7_9GLOM|nr:4521_t:CDS:2 [Cetraspora pellucida]